MILAQLLLNGSLDDLVEEFELLASCLGFNDTLYPLTNWLLHYRRDVNPGLQMQIENGLNDRVLFKGRGLLFSHVYQSSFKKLNEGLKLLWVVSQALSELF